MSNVLVCSDPWNRKRKIGQLIYVGIKTDTNQDCVSFQLLPPSLEKTIQGQKKWGGGESKLFLKTPPVSLDVLCVLCQENGHISIYPHLEFLSVKDPNSFSCQPNLAGFSVVTEAGQAFFFCEVVEAAWETENAFFLLHKHRCWCVNWGEMG